MGEKKYLEQDRASALDSSIHISCADYQDFMNELLPGSIDLILTDPPYNISRETGFANVGTKGIERFAVSMNFGEWDHSPIDLSALAKLSYRALRKGGTLVVFYDLWELTTLRNSLQEAKFKMLRLIEWRKTNPVPLNASRTYLSNSREVAVCAVKVGKPTFNNYYHSGDYDTVIEDYSLPIPRHNGRRIHPTQKPDELFRQIIKTHANPGDIVVDPFLGGGTTAVAAYEEGMRFSGCDISPAYVEASRRRFNGE